MVNITIYSKKNCHLCDIAKEALINIRKEFPFSLIEVDIEKDREIFEKYKYLIPVIEIDGEKTFTYKVNEDELKTILKLKSQPQ
ncbi:MAG: glutaredoxin family protein [Candidatus Methanoperedens sp.]|nr:glutaredoxin family protein [Candidatus Methanoperedens sp.]